MQAAAPNYVFVKLLGKFEARNSNGKPLSVRSRRARVLLACLAADWSRIWTRDSLAALVWEGRSPELARASLRQELSRMKIDMALSKTDKWTDGDVVRLPPKISVDVSLFEAAVSNGNAQAAALLYQGDLLEDTKVAGSAAETWLAGKRNDIRNVAITSCIQALHSSAAFDSVEATEKVARRLTTLDPACEIGHRALIKIHIVRGNLVLALEQYRLCARHLEVQCRRQPTSETRSLLEEAIISLNAVQPEKASDTFGFDWLLHREAETNISNSIQRLPQDERGARRAENAEWLLRTIGCGGEVRRGRAN